MLVNGRSLKILLLLSVVSWVSSYEYNFVLVSQSLPVPVYATGSTVVGESVFIIGGMDNEGGFPINSVREFNARTKAWTSLPEYAQKVYDPCVVSDGSEKIFVFGGYSDTDGYSNLQGMYNILAQQWEYSTMPFSTSSAACVWNSDTDRIHVFLPFGDIWIYNPFDDSYGAVSSTPDIIVPHYGSVAFFQENSIYFAGLNLTKYIDNVWIPLQNPFAPRSATGGFATSDSLWLLGGADDTPNFNPQPTIQRYDFAQDEWTDEGNIPIAVKSHVVARVGPSVLIIGGNIGTALTDTVYIITCLLPCANPLDTCDIETGMCSNSTPSVSPIGTPMTDTPLNEPVYVPINSLVEAPIMGAPIAPPMDVPLTAPSDVPIISTPIDAPINPPIDTPVASPTPASSPITSGTPIGPNSPGSAPVASPVASPMSSPAIVPSSNTPTGSSSPTPASTPSSPNVNVPMVSSAPNSSPSKTPNGVTAPRSILGGVSDGVTLTINSILFVVVLAIL